MYNNARYSLVAIVFVLVGCQPAADLTVSFDEDVLPLLNRHCAVCHMGEGAQGEFSLYPTPYQSLVNAKSKQSSLVLVEPGSKQNSYLYHKLLGTQKEVNGSGASMPYQRNLLMEADLAIIFKWIEEGATQN